ncbi:hypothetical protein GOP47_0003078 [Adiantum capillus-veneris]|uniref:RING-type domain-containing protein n=1 Tax=Adiantum capillus-veneris TaxID=13818 RepID=A0A9D4ZS68_ADICA|nr:hypothetical protein GOP47_0003078 [Adiantum capillus-veneris]
MVLLEGAKDDKEEVKENEDGHGHASSSHDVLRAYTALYESISSPTKEWPASKEEDIEESPKEKPFLSCIEPLMKKFEENLHHEFAYVKRLQDLVTLLHQENKSLKEEVEDLNDFIFSAKLTPSASEEEDVTTLHNKVHTLQAALRIESLKANEYKKELDDARHALMRRTRATVKKGQSFELIIAQKPHEVTLASHATPFQDETYTGSCPICLEEFDIASGWYTLNCRHRYHLVCLAQVMPTRARCCVCNQELHKLLYEIFGIANRYPDDARLWDAQTGQPVDFTLEEDIRALANEIQESQETDGEADEEEANISNAGEEISIASDYSGGDIDQSGDDPVDSQLDDHNSQQEEEEEEETTEEEEEEETTGSDRSTDEDREDNEEYSDGDESYVSSANEEEDPTDPDYTPGQE